MFRKNIIGVILEKNIKTVTVGIKRQVSNNIYKKNVLKMKKILVHNEIYNVKIGNKVTVTHTRPISKKKKWILIKKY